MRLTVESTEPIDSVLRAVGALYGVQLVVAGADPASAAPAPSRKAVSSRTPKTVAPKAKKVAKVPVVAAAARPRATQATAGQADIRRWAQEAGLTVAGRGRLSATIRDAYTQAHRGK
jgi:nucleoid-associated protein YgaU